MGEEVAAARLASALVEQGQLRSAYANAVGTAGETIAAVRLRSADLRVATCRRMHEAACSRLYAREVPLRS